MPSIKPNQLTAIPADMAIQQFSYHPPVKQAALPPRYRVVYFDKDSDKTRQAEFSRDSAACNFAQHLVDTGCDPETVQVKQVR